MLVELLGDIAVWTAVGALVLFLVASITRYGGAALTP
jgi:hypothetical protein